MGILLSGASHSRQKRRSRQRRRSLFADPIFLANLFAVALLLASFPTDRVSYANGKDRDSSTTTAARRRRSVAVPTTIETTRVDEILYATDAVSIDECTLHRMNVSNGRSLEEIGPVRTSDGTSMGVFGMCWSSFSRRRHQNEDVATTTTTGTPPTKTILYALNHMDWSSLGSGSSSRRRQNEDAATDSASTTTATTILYAVNHMDQLMTIDTRTAIATVIGDGVGVNGLYDLACLPVVVEERDDEEGESSNATTTTTMTVQLFSYTSVTNQIVKIDANTGHGTSLNANYTFPETDAISMDIDPIHHNCIAPSASCRRPVLWLLHNGKTLYSINTQTGLPITTTNLFDDRIPQVNQRNGSIRRYNSKNNNNEDDDHGDSNRIRLYSAFFEDDPSSIWVVDIEDAKMYDIIRTNLTATYTLAFAYPSTTTRVELMNR